MDQKTIYKKLFRTIKPYLLILILAIVGLLCTKLIEGFVYKFVAPQIFESFTAIKLSFLQKILPLVILLSALSWGISRFANKYLVGRLTKSVTKDLRSKILAHMLLVPINFFSKNAIGNLISKVNYDVEQISRAIADSILDLLSSIISIIVFTGVMLSISWQLTVIVLILAPVISKFLQLVNIKIRKHSDMVQQSIGDISQLTHEVIEACQIIRIFEAITTETNRINRLMNYNLKQELKIIEVSSLSESTMGLILGSIGAVLSYLVIHKIIIITPGSFVGLSGAMYALTRQVKKLSEVNSVIAKGLAAAYSVFELLGLPIEPNNPSKSINFKNIKNNIKINLHNVNFGYTNPTANDPQLVLEDINLTFESGKTTAIIGRSGSGKSSLIALLPRFYYVNSGFINLNGININDLDLQELRRLFAVVNQNIILLNDTVANNIAYGCMNGASKKAIIKAANAANAMEFVEELPNGLDTYIGNNGGLLSGGQRQRIAIARAILKDAPILILDEATSSLDPNSEQQIQAALVKLKANRVTIVIAHRLSTIENADQIAVLEAGRLVAVGTHQELSKDLYYTNLHKTVANEAV